MSTITPKISKQTPLFALKYVRLLFRAQVAMEIGKDAVVLLVYVVHAEDAVRFSQPVGDYACDLAKALGLSVSNLERARARAISAGWLGYTAGAKGRPAKYWVTIPQDYQGFQDGPIDFSSEEILRRPDGVSGEYVMEKGILRQPEGESDGESRPHPTDTIPYDLNPIPCAPPSAGERFPEHLGKQSKAKMSEKPKTPRPANLLFDAIVEVTGCSPNLNGGLIGKVSAALARETPPYTPEEVHEFGRRYHEICTYAVEKKRLRPSAGEIQKYISQIRVKPPPVTVSSRPSTNAYDD